MKRLFTLCILTMVVGIVKAQVPQKESINCIPTYPNTCGVYIIKVTTTGGIQNITNSTNCASPAYTSYSGVNKTLELNAGQNFQAYADYYNQGINLGRWAIWIDYDHDGSFNNEIYNPTTHNGEIITNMTNSSTPPVIVCTPFAKDGPTKMRVRLFVGQDPQKGPQVPIGVGYPTGPLASCTTASNVYWGETEDYDVIIHNPCKKIPSVSITNVTSKGADISWTVNGNERLVEYMIDQSPNDPGNGNFLLNNTQTSIHVPDTNTRRINCNTKYYFHIRDVCDTDSHSQATWSYGPWRLDSFQTPACCDVPPITVDNITANTAIASWGPVTSVIQYEYAVSISDSPEPTGGTRYNGTTTLLPGLDCSREYYFFLRALCSPTPTSDWGIDSFLTQPCTSIDNSPVLPEFKLNAYPNPTRNVVTLSVMHGIKREVGTIEVMDVTGKVLKTAVMDGDKLDLNLNDVPSGLYMIRYSDEQRTQVIKVRRE
ncbi:MAG: T9SS type A sorting domain-containing protein [Flavipsychrobacter sp.]